MCTMVARREQQIPHPRTRVDSRWLLCGWVMGIKLRSAGKQQMFSAIESSLQLLLNPAYHPTLYILLCLIHCLGLFGGPEYTKQASLSGAKHWLICLEAFFHRFM